MFVDDLGPHRRRIVHPDDHANLDEIVERNQGNDESKQTFENGKEGKDHPVGEPLRVVLASRIHGLKRHVSGVQEAEKVHHELQSTDERRNDSHKDAGREEKECFGEARLGLEFLEQFCKRNIANTKS